MTCSSIFMCVVEYVQPVCLPAYGQRLIDGQMGTVTGWGNVGYYGESTFNAFMLLFTAECFLGDYIISIFLFYKEVFILIT